MHSRACKRQIWWNGHRRGFFYRRVQGTHGKGAANAGCFTDIGGVERFTCNAQLCTLGYLPGRQGAGGRAGGVTPGLGKGGCYCDTVLQLWSPVPSMGHAGSGCGCSPPFACRRSALLHSAVLPTHCRATTASALTHIIRPQPSPAADVNGRWRLADLLSQLRVK